MTLFRRALLSFAILIAVVTSGAAQRKTLDADYREVAGKLLGAALVDQGGWEKLSYLTTRIGNRLSGSANLERAVQWASQQMKADGLENVKLQPVKVPHWVRGGESAKMVEPYEKQFN